MRSRISAMSKEVKEFASGNLVWAKMKSYSWWPAMVLDPSDCRKNVSKDNYWIFWFGDHKFSQVNKMKIKDFEDCFRNFSTSKGNLFQKALKEILEVLASLNNVKLHKDSSKLIKWANKGFPHDSPNCFTWNKSELPQIIKCSLSEWLRKSEPESDSDIEWDDALNDFQKGLKKFEEICISCCKKNAEIIAPHPLLDGNICRVCKKGVLKACKMPVGQMQDLCIVCGQGGNLVICSNSLCLRSFCKTCIEYLISTATYEKIVQDDEWVCFLCKVNMDENCLIKRRKIHFASLTLSPKTPKHKRPINVLAFSEIGLKVLKKANITVGNYKVNPAPETTPCKMIEYSDRYKDFTFKELADISADLVMGSFDTPTALFDRKDCTALFFVAFYRFLYRLDVSRLYQDNVFFIFWAEVQQLDDNITSRVLRFLMVDPAVIPCGQNTIMLWSNISTCAPFSLKKIDKEPYKTKENILFYYMKNLQNYFETK